MTKVRPPVSIELALGRIADQLEGWPRLAEVVGRAEATVRSWGDPDRPEDVPLRCAIALDAAFRKAGGDGAPLHDVYAKLLKSNLEHVFATQAEIAIASGLLARESGEAIAAQIICAQPSAGPADIEAAIRETEQQVDAANAQLERLRLLKAGRPPAPDTS